VDDHRTVRRDGRRREYDRRIRAGVVFNKLPTPAPSSRSYTRGVYLLTPTRKNVRHVASPFQLACLHLRHRVEDLF
jgi:hypothetical protein